MAELEAVTCVINALSPIKKKKNYRNAIWCTFSDPELAHLGMTERQAKENHGGQIKVYRHNYSEMDRAVTDSASSGFGKFICDRKGNLLGAHILGANASDLIHETQIIRTFGMKLSKLQSVIHLYPSYSDLIRKVARKAYIESIQDNFFVKMLRKFV